MTPEQAMEVWRGALNAAQGPGPDFDTADQAAASVILAWAEKREAGLREALLDAQAESELAQVLARDEGQSETLAMIDRMTGGDGEYRVSTDPERHCPEECAMITKIVGRFDAIRANAKANNTLARHETAGRKAATHRAAMLGNALEALIESVERGDVSTTDLADCRTLLADHRSAG